jgi:hypothetical protein
MAPSSRTPPFGTTFLYSNQKSNKSPSRWISVAGPLAAIPRPSDTSSNQLINFFSRKRLDSMSGTPRCKSDAKYTRWLKILIVDCGSYLNSFSSSVSSALPRKCVSMITPSRPTSNACGMLEMPYSRDAAFFHPCKSQT